MSLKNYFKSIKINFYSTYTYVKPNQLLKYLLKISLKIRLISITVMYDRFIGLITS